MIIIKPSYQILSKIEGFEMLRSIERAGRTCYKSEDAITSNSATKFITMIISKGHESVLEHEKISVLFICDRGVSHEIVRHRLASFSQESTRYCNYSKDKFDNGISIIHPTGLLDSQIERRNVYYQATQELYMSEISEGIIPQIARGVLPTALKTEIVVTANLREWRTIFKQRTSSAAHPQMRELMIPLLEDLKELIPVVFNDIEY